MLMYKKVLRSEQVVERELKPYTNWGMFSSAGNRSLRNKAQTLINNIEKAKSWEDKSKAFKKYFKSWRSMHDTKTMRESSDTAVRETVWCFAEKVAKAIGFSTFTLDDIWENSY